jgi:cephalosporin hydroxylase
MLQEKILWQDDTIQLDDLTFGLQVHHHEDIRKGNEGFVFYKDKKLIDMYQDFFKTQENLQLDRILEIGMWDGGSAVFWHKVLQPKTLIGVDLMKNRKGKAFEKYKTQHSESFHDYWEVDQTDGAKLKEILHKHLDDQPLDLVFDDASHRYHQSLASFNVVFPYLRKGGYYIIEDWAWVHWLHEDSSSYPDYTEPTRLIFELVEAAGNVGLIDSIQVYSGFTVVKRGQLDIPKESFRLHNYIKRRPVKTLSRLKRRIKQFLGRSW